MSVSVGGAVWAFGCGLVRACARAEGVRVCVPRIGARAVCVGAGVCGSGGALRCVCPCAVCGARVARSVLCAACVVCGS